MGVLLIQLTGGWPVQLLTARAYFNILTVVPLLGRSPFALGSLALTSLVGIGHCCIHAKVILRSFNEKENWRVAYAASFGKPIPRTNHSSCPDITVTSTCQGIDTKF